MNTTDKADLRIPESPYAEAYEEFVSLLESGVPIQSWKAVAEAFDKDQDTITRWKRTPRAQSAIKKSIKKAIVGMQKSGKDDWRMWDRYAKLMGVDATDQVDLTSGGEKVKPIININSFDKETIENLGSKDIFNTLNGLATEEKQ